MTDPLIFPVGHYTGPFHAARGAPPQHHTLRVGWNERQLAEGAEVSLWMLSHGFLDVISVRPWTRSTLLEAADAAKFGDAAAQLNDLLERGVLVAVQRGGDDTETFARGHRIESLLVGLGNTPDKPLDFGIGLPGVGPAVLVDDLLYQFWLWGHFTPSLWEACEVLAAANVEVGSGPTTPPAMLDSVLAGLHRLTAAGAAYLDVARQPVGA